LPIAPPIRDGREVYAGGERVKNVTSHPVFQPLVDYARASTTCSMSS